MQYASPSLGTGSAVPMKWGGYKAMLPADERAALRSDPLNRTESEAAMALMRTGIGPDDVAGFLLSPDGSNPYVDQSRKWLDTATFSRSCQIVGVPN